MFGSGWICLEISGDKEKRQSVYQRLMFVFSFIDFWVSVAYFCTTWPVPPSPKSVWSIGNDLTCKIQGYWLQMGAASFVYSAALTIYFVMVIKYQMKEREIKRWEPWLHAPALLFSFGTSTASLFMNHYGNSNLWCWITGGTTPGALYRWIFYYVELWICFLVVLFGMGFIIRGVQVTERESAKHDAAHKASMEMLTKTKDVEGEGDLSSREKRKEEKARREKIRKEQLRQTKRTRQVAVQALLYGTYIVRSMVVSSTYTVFHCTPLLSRLDLTHFSLLSFWSKYSFDVLHDLFLPHRQPVIPGHYW
jgi:hypothetical protein